MLIESASRPEALSEAGLRWWTNERFAIGWKGHLFLPGMAGGEATIARLAESLPQRGLAEIVPELGGVFGLFVYDRTRQAWQIACDNAGLYKIFHDRHGAGTRFLELLTARGYGPEHADTEVILTFLAHGAILGPATFVTGVRKLARDEILLLQPDAPPRLAAKHLAPPAGGDTETVLARFNEIARSLMGRKVSVDLTGGFDSRVMTCLLHKDGVPFEGALSGDPDSADATTAAQVAKLIGCPLRVVTHDIGRLETELADVFRDGDGLTDLRRLHRDRQAALARLARGVEVIVHGGAGELFRDHNFIHDFPRYGSSQVNFERYYAVRLRPVPLPEAYLTPAAAAQMAAVRTHAIERLSRQRAATNNETFDRIYYLERSPDFYGQYFANYLNLGLDVVAPFLDWQIAHVGMRLPPWRRFFQSWHRRLLTRVQPELAALPTAEGYSASAEPARVARDAWGFGTTQLSRLGKKVTQRFLGKAMFHKVGAFAADDPGFMAALRASSTFATALARLKAAGILAPDLAPAAIRDIHVGRIMTTGLVLEHLDGYP